MGATGKSRLKSHEGLALAALASLVAVLAYRHGITSYDAVIIPALFALGGWLLRGVSGTGALAGGGVAFILYAAGGWRMFAVLFAVFVLTLVSTFAGRSRKLALGVAEEGGGRNAAQVGANLFVAAGSLVFLPAPFAWVVALAALAEAAADTVSSEIGEAFSEKTYLVSTLRPTAPGTNGGVSGIGTLAGLAAAVAVAASAYGSIGTADLALVAIAGTLGMLIDSVVGATLENRGLLNNDAVNLCGTAGAAGIAYAVCRLY
jgi:uncharacterized protein (TIGR00297 family)